jgi:hypothetical protein
VDSLTLVVAGIALFAFGLAYAGDLDRRYYVPLRSVVVMNAYLVAGSVLFVAGIVAAVL